MSGKPVKLSDFGLSEEFGYMQISDPVRHLGPENAAWDEMAANLPKYLMCEDFRSRVKKLPDFKVSALKSEGEIRRAFLAISYIGMAYQWSSNEAAHSIPAVLAKPWYEVGKLVGRPPILSYTSYSIDNWYRVSHNGKFSRWKPASFTVAETSSTNF